MLLVGNQKCANLLKLSSIFSVPKLFASQRISNVCVSIGDQNLTCDTILCIRPGPVFMSGG